MPVAKLGSHCTAPGSRIFAPPDSIRGRSSGTRNSRVPGECSERSCASGTRPGTHCQRAKHLIRHRRVICERDALPRAAAILDGKAGGFDETPPALDLLLDLRLELRAGFARD